MSSVRLTQPDHIHEMFKSKSILAMLLCLSLAHCMVINSSPAASVARCEDVAGARIVSEDGSGHAMQEPLEGYQATQKSKSGTAWQKLSTIDEGDEEDEKLITSVDDTIPVQGLLIRKYNKTVQTLHRTISSEFVQTLYRIILSEFSTRSREAQSIPKQAKDISTNPESKLIKRLKESSDMISTRFREMVESVPGSQRIQKFASTWGLYFLTLYIISRDHPSFMISKQQKRIPWLLLQKCRRILHA